MPSDRKQVRDVRNVQRDKVRRSIILSVNDDGWCEVISARGNPGIGPHVLVRHERKEAKLLNLTKDTAFRLDNIEWVPPEDVGEIAGRRCPPGLMERIRRMQQDAALGLVDPSIY